jgi:hypothetical protein
VDEPRPSSLKWRKSSYSGPDGGCIEVAAGERPGIIAIRDSKDADGPRLIFVATKWHKFISGFKINELNRT